MKIKLSKTGLKNIAPQRACGLTPHAIIEVFCTIQMVDVHLPATDGWHLVLPRRVQPTKEHAFPLHQLGMTLPAQGTATLFVTTCRPSVAV